MCKEKCGSKCVGHWVMWGLLIIGGLNWGLVGIFNFDLVATIFGDMSVVSRIVYILVALSAVTALFGGCRCKKCCGKGGACGSNETCVDGVCCAKDDAGCAACKNGVCEMHGASEDKEM